ncbi:putative vacuolar protein sorting (Vps33) [Fasciola gigantica]|uniref:Putative vacuolar protein sorting (Vps33) n=1 Tax=Fasciola gigantica TaxID=46835 RepID=A0A504YF86_FASGI|nr:putative vacuolar protein sorting (Vps33) [Fasciola gigantica]
MFFDSYQLQQSRWKCIAKAFSKLPGEKILLVEPDLLQPLDRVASMSMLRKLKVMKIFKIDTLPPKKDYEKIAYILPPTPDSVNIIAKHYDVDAAHEIKRMRLVIFVPQETQDVRYLLESKGLSGNQICVTELSLGWISLDNDLASLNLPVLYADYFLYGDYTWPHFMGTQLGELLQLACDSELAPLGCRVHALGEAATVVASGVRLHCIRSGLVKRVSQVRLDTTPRANKSSDHLHRWGSQSSVNSSQDTSSSDTTNTTRPPPLVIVFSRDLDYVTPLLLPMTFEALIHEIIGIDLGIVTISDPSSNEPGPQKQFLSGSKMHYYKDARDVHIAHICTLLNQWRTSLQEKKTSLETELAGRSVTGPFATGESVHELKALSAQVGPLLAQRRELTLLLLALEKVMDALTRRERVEDVRAAQTLLLRSGSGGSLALAQSQSVVSADDTGSQISHVLSPNQSSESKHTAAGGNCGTIADDLNSVPLRLVMEWLSTYRGDRLIDGIRLASLASVTHDGLADETYNILHRAILHAAGQIAFPMLLALRKLKLLAPRSAYLSIGAQMDPKHPPLLENGLGSPPTTTAASAHSAGSSSIQSVSKSALSAAVARLGLITKRKSLYNRLHHLLKLSHAGQTNRPVNQPPVSPTYVYSGQHCPVVVRLAESIWATSLFPSSASSTSVSSHTGPEILSDLTKSGSRTTDPELLTKSQLISALKLLGIPEQAASNLGLVSFADPSLAAAGYQTEQFNHMHRLNAPMAKPLPCLASEQPVIVVFPGGCTYGEVAALRFVAARRRWHLLIATSALLTSRDLLQQAGQAACSPGGSDSSS